MNDDEDDNVAIIEALGAGNRAIVKLARITAACDQLMTEVAYADTPIFDATHWAVIRIRAILDSDRE